MEYNLMRQFERHMIQTGKPESFEGCAPSTTEKLQSKLSSALSSSVPCPATAAGRRLNNFCIGSDPEFVFVAPGERKKTHAHALGLSPGLAVGCDQNLRLAELRGYPSTSVIEHVAGILSSLRWMFRVYPETRGYCWRAGAYHDGDGLGGHVHFGRKRPDRVAEVKALDGVAVALRNMQIFNIVDWEKRQQPDQHNNQGYGKPGDFRVQLHGYEYRALPSWLCSPLKSFVVLTAMKLAVLDPELTSPWSSDQCINFKEGLNLLHRLARYYAGRDDDAWMLKHLLMRPDFELTARGWQRVVPDFKQNWGFDGAYSLGVAKDFILPATIAPLPSEIQEIAGHITEAVPLHYVENKPTFRASLPKDYYWVPSTITKGINWPGVGDLIHNLVGYKNCPVQFLFDRVMRVSEEIWHNWNDHQRNGAKNLIPTLVLERGLNNCIIIDRQMLGLKGLVALRRLLLEDNRFPLWTVNSVTENSVIDHFKILKPLIRPFAKKNPRERNL